MNFNKIKKIFSFVLIMFVALCLVGCGDANTSVGVARNLENSANKPDSIVSKLEEVDYDDIVIGELSPFASSENGQGTNVSALKKTKTYTVGNSDVQMTSQEKPRNATFVNARKSKIDLPRNEKNFENLKTLRNTSKKYDCEDGNCEPITNTNTQNNFSNNVIGANQKTRKTSENQYTARRTSTYKPRFVNETSESFSRDTLDRYLDSIELLYDDCADCISCNAECKNESSRLSQNLNDCKILCQKLSDGTIQLSESEILECNNKINNLKNYMSRLNSTKGNILAKCKDIAKNKNNFSSNVDILQNSYEKLYSALESRLDCLQQCNACICEICDIINKTNVDMREAEKNRSDEDDIVFDEQKIKDEQRNVFENDLTKPANKQENITQNISNKTQKSNNTKTNRISNRNSITKTNQTRRTEKSRINAENISKNARNSNANYTQTKNISQHKIKNTSGNTEDKNIQQYENENNYKTQSENTELQTNNENSNTRTQNTMPDNNSNNTMANNPRYTNQNVTSNPNGYGYNGPYQNGVYPYPPRNIDTYRNINKNIDTYAPNYIPQQNTNVLNTQNQNNAVNQAQTNTQQDGNLNGTLANNENENQNNNNLDSNNTTYNNDNNQLNQTTENNSNVVTNNEADGQNTSTMQNTDNNGLILHNTTENTDQNANNKKFEGSFPTEEVVMR